MKIKYYNKKFDVYIIFDDEDFTMVGGHDDITDQDIEDLYHGKTVSGWEILTTDDDKFYVDVLTN